MAERRYGLINKAISSVLVGAVTEHQAALTIIEGQITGAAFTNWNTAFGWGNHASGGYATSGGAFHDGFSDFVANEHLRWDLTGVGTVHINNIPTGVTSSTVSLGNHTHVETKFKTADTTIDDVGVGSTLTDDPHMAGYTLLAASIYKVTAFLSADAISGNEDIKWVLQFSNAPVSSYQEWKSAVPSGAGESDGAGTFLVAQVATLNTAKRGISITGYVKTHATLSANVDFQWAQDSSNSDSITLYLGSWLTFELLGSS